MEGTCLHALFKHSILALTALPILLGTPLDINMLFVATRCSNMTDGVGLGDSALRGLSEKSIPENAGYIRK